MRDDVSMFQQLIFSILMRHKDELYSHLDKMILEQVTEVKINDIIRKMFYELKMPNLDEKILAFINNEFTSVIGKHVDEYDVELKVQAHLKKMIDQKTEEVLKESYAPKTHHDDILLEDFYIKKHDKYHENGFFPTRIINCLKTEGLKTVGDLLCWCPHQLLRTPNLGKKSLDKIKLVLNLANLSLGKKNNQRFKEYDSKCYSCKVKENPGLK